MHTCPDCGIEHEQPMPEVVVEEAMDPEPIADASVEVARIEADRDIAVAKIEHKALDEELVMQLSALQARLDALEAMNAPEPEPEPVVITEAPAPEPEPMEPPKAEERPEEPRPKAKKRGFF